MTLCRHAARPRSVALALACAFGTLVTLSACGPKTTAPSSTSSAASDSASAASPMAGIKPQPLDMPASSPSGTAGPADAATAVGGMTGGPATGGGGGSTGGAAPAPTGGDGAASAPSGAASK